MVQPDQKRESSVLGRGSGKADEQKGIVGRNTVEKHTPKYRVRKWEKEFFYTIGVETEKKWGIGPQKKNLDAGSKVGKTEAGAQTVAQMSQSREEGFHERIPGRETPWEGTREISANWLLRYIKAIRADAKSASICFSFGKRERVDWKKAEYWRYYSRKENLSIRAK